jgi:hypothetical protein
MRIRRGKGVFLSGAVQAAAAPLFSAALEASDSPLLAHLKSAGPSLVEDVKDELGWDAKRLRSERAAPEKVGALLHRGVELPAANGGHIHTAELVRWDQLDVEPTTSSAEDALDALTVAAVRAAVCAPRKEVQRWFSWAPDIDRLIADGRVRAIGDAVACVAP